MAKLTVDTSRAEARLRKAKKVFRVGAGIANQRGAEVLKTELVSAVPRRTGRFQESFDIVNRRGRTGDRWFVRVPRSKFGAFFYPILFRELLRTVVQRSSPRVKQVMKGGFLGYIRGLF